MEGFKPQATNEKLQDHGCYHRTNVYRAWGRRRGTIQGVTKGKDEVRIRGARRRGKVIGGNRGKDGPTRSVIPSSPAYAVNMKDLRLGVVSGGERRRAAVPRVQHEPRQTTSKVGKSRTDARAKYERGRHSQR